MSLTSCKAFQRGPGSTLVFVETIRAEALELSKGLPASASNISRVADRTSPEAARWAFGQWDLRAKAIKKGFPRAEELLFDWRVIEQATHFAIARYHASLFPQGALVGDLTVGAGADLIALAERGPVIGYDVDEERLEYVRYNLSVLGLDAELVLNDCLAADWKFEYALADPSRRDDSGDNGFRVDSIEFCKPSPLALAQRMSQLRFGLMKLSPMFTNQALHSLGSRVDFISYGRECRESLVYLGTSASEGKLAAPSQEGYSVVKAHRNRDLVSIDEEFDEYESNAVKVETGEVIPSSQPPAKVAEPSTFLYEADPAAIRAHGLGFLAKRYSLLGVGDSNGYLTSSEEISSVWLAGFRVLAFGHFDKKLARAKLAQLGGGTPIVKSRSPRINVDRVRKDLATKGKLVPIIAIYPVGLSLRFAILERL